MVGFSDARVVGVEVYAGVEGGGGFEGTRVDGFESEVGAGFDCGL